MANRHDQLPPLDPLQRYSMLEAAAYLRVGKPSVYKLIRAGTIATIVSGRRRFIPGSELVRLSSAPAAA